VDQQPFFGKQVLDIYAAGEQVNVERLAQADKIGDHRDIAAGALYAYAQIRGARALLSFDVPARRGNQRRVDPRCALAQSSAARWRTAAFRHDGAASHESRAAEIAAFCARLASREDAKLVVPCDQPLRWALSSR
jgi:hypothetical protein